MAATSHPTEETSERAPFPFLAILGAGGAALAFAGTAAATRQLGGNPAGMVAGTIVMALATAGLLLPWTRTVALLLAWNGLGIALGLFVIGIFSVGALMAFPLALIAIALSAWPLRDDRSALSLPAIVVQVGGFLLVFQLYGVLDNLIAGIGRTIGGWLG